MRLAFRLTLFSLACVSILPVQVPGAAHAEVKVLDVVDFVPPGQPRGPWGVDVDEVAGLAYVAGLESPYRLAVVDAEAHQVVARIALSGLYPHGVAAYPEAHRVYVSHTGTGNVSVVDALTQQELTTIPVGDVPMDLCVNRATGLIYVPRMYAGDVVVVDVATSTPVDTIDVGAYPCDICVNETTNRVYVANLSDWSVSVIDGALGAVIATVRVGAYPEGIAVNEATNLVYVANRDDNTVSVMSGFTHAVLDTVSVGEEPRKVGVDSARNLIYVANSGSNDVSVIDGSGLGVVATIPVGRMPQGGVAVDRHLGRVFVTNYESDDVSVIGGSEGRVVATVRLGWFPYETACQAPDGSWFVTNWWGNDVAALESAGSVPAWDAAIGYSPGSLCVDAQRERVFVTQPDADRVFSLDVETGAITDTLAVGDDPRGICVNGLTGTLYVANSGSASISVIDPAGGAVTTIPLSHEPLDVEVNTQTNMVYASAWFGMLYAIDGRTNTLADSLQLHFFCEPRYLAVNERTNRIYVAALNCDVMWVVSGSPFQVEAAIPLPFFPGGICTSWRLGKAYVCSGESLTVIAPDNTIAEYVPLGRPGAGCCMDQERSLIYVGCPDAGGVVILVDAEGAAVDARTGGDGVPAEGSLSLTRVWPNPARQEASIGVSLAAEEPASLRIYDVRGTLVRTLFRGRAGAGSFAVAWDGTGDRGERVAPGIYLVSLQTAERTETRKITILR